MSVRQFLLDLDALNESTATFMWRDGETVDRVAASVPRHEWEIDRPTRITVILGETL